ncbi:MAG: SMC-Scp complex subunit ScpB [Bacteroidetes bacterium]|nr:SMC-Scp complex subunit ScpB [Bacteroidota bacterium]
MELLKQQIEALIFCSEQCISLDEIAASLKISFDWELTDEEMIDAIEGIKAKYTSEDFAFELVEISEGYQFLTKKQFYPTVSALIQHKAKKKLSVSQMETLAIIAYRQPIAKSEIEHIRGVSCDYAIHKLLEKELIEISGKSDGPGRPVLYSTSKLFMDYFGIKSVKDLPQLKDLHVEQNEIGTSSELSDAFDVVPDGAEQLDRDGEGVTLSPEEISAETTENIEMSSEEVTINEFSDNENPAADFGSENEMSNETDENVTDLVNAEEGMNIPDRKAIYLENQSNIEASSDEDAEIKKDTSEE